MPLGLALSLLPHRFRPPLKQVNPICCQPCPGNIRWRCSSHSRSLLRWLGSLHWRKFIGRNSRNSDARLQGLLLPFDPLPAADNTWRISGDGMANLPGVAPRSLNTGTSPFETPALFHDTRMVCRESACGWQSRRFGGGAGRCGVKHGTYPVTVAMICRSRRVTAKNHQRSPKKAGELRLSD
jgi:hypothetical protein